MVTVRELARSQGFPDSFVFDSINDNVVTVRPIRHPWLVSAFLQGMTESFFSPYQMHRQIGNAVPWPVAAAIGRELREARLKKWRKERQDVMVVD